MTILAAFDQYVGGVLQDLRFVREESAFILAYLCIVKACISMAILGDLLFSADLTKLRFLWPAFYFLFLRGLHYYPYAMCNE